NVPSAATVLETLWLTSAVTRGTSPTWPPRIIASRNAWVTTNAAKTGSRVVIDSLTPRMLSVDSIKRPAISTGNFAGAQAGGRRLNTASAPEAIETVIVRT